MKQRRLIIGAIVVVGIVAGVFLARPTGKSPAIENLSPASSDNATPPSAIPIAKVSSPALTSVTVPGPPAPEASIPATSGLPPAREMAPVTANTSGVPAPGAAPVSPAEIEAEIEDVQLALRDFRTGMGGNPVGNNAEITKALLGDNLKQIKIPVPAGSHVNGEGELTDRWGTPYFFHQISSTRMEIRSAGPDRKMWSTDDVQK